MATRVTNSSRALVRAALALALAGLLAALSGGLLIVTGGSASSVPTADDQCVPAEAWTETTGWLTESPGDGWYVVDEQTVVDQEATRTETDWVTDSPGDGWVQFDERVATAEVDQWWHWNGSNQGVPPPPPPAEGWNTDNGDHTGLMNKDDYAPNTVFDASVKGGDNASWFYHESRAATYEYRYYLETPAVTHVEHVFAFDHPAVTCEDEPTEPPEVLPTEETEETEPTGPAGPDEPAGPTAPADVTGPGQAADLEVLGEQATRPTRTVPQAVEAGVVGWTTPEMWGAGLVGGGLVLLLAAGGALLGARRLEAS